MRLLDRFFDSMAIERRSASSVNKASKKARIAESIRMVVDMIYHYLRKKKSFISVILILSINVNYRALKYLIATNFLY